MSEPQIPYYVDGPILLMECPVAGFQFHDGESLWARMKPWDTLTLRREPGNRHDTRAVRVEWQGVALGYVPREANYAVSQMLDRGEAVEARIRELRASADPWKRVMIEVAVAGVTRGSTPRKVPASAPQEAIAIDPCVRMKHLPKLQLAPVGGTDDRWPKAMAVVESVHAEIARRLALPAVACAGNALRTLTLWNTIELSIDSKGRNLQARFVDGAADVRPLASLDLARPIGHFSWSQAFVPLLERECVKHGLRPEQLVGPVGAWIHRSLRLTFGRYIDFRALRRTALEVLAPDPLAHALANRIFGHGALAERFNWVGDHVPALAQVGIDHPALLPFLRFLPESHAAGANPRGTLYEHFVTHGMLPAAWARLEQWGFKAFDDFLDSMADVPDSVVEYANLLHRLEVQDPPPDLFSFLAGQAAAFANDDVATRTLRWIPDWFMRALLRETEETDAEDADRLAGELGIALTWLCDTNPDPDSNQRKAGWFWISHQAIEHDLKREAMKWTVPCETLVEGPYIIVPLRSGAELREEAVAMMNCLENYERRCARGELIVFSIRRQDNGKRLACFTVSRSDDKWRMWEVDQIAGKMNSSTSPEMSRVADTVLARLNREKPF